MEINPPYGYKAIAPLDKKTRLKAATGALPEFAGKTNVVPLTLGESMLASLDYPVAFARNGETGPYVLVAVMGLEPTENLFVSAENEWTPGIYMPAYIRRYPFCVTRPAPGTAQPGTPSLVCVEKEWISEDGKTNFDDAGNPTPEWTAISNFINEYEGDIDRTRELCSIFADMRMLEPFQFNGTIGDKNMSLGGMHRIDVKRLEFLNTNEIRNLFKRGGLATLYLHLASLNRFSRLLSLKTERIVRAGQVNGSAS